MGKDSRKPSSSHKKNQDIDSEFSATLHKKRTLDEIETDTYGDSIIQSKHKHDDHRKHHSKEKIDIEDEPELTSSMPTESASKSHENKDEITKNICNHTRRCLKARGITKLFPIQEATFDHVMNGVDLIGRALTGSGKTLAFVCLIFRNFDRFH